MGNELGSIGNHDAGSKMHIWFTRHSYSVSSQLKSPKYSLVPQWEQYKVGGSRQILINKLFKAKNQPLQMFNNFDSS